MERYGGEDAYLSIKRMIPTYESCIFIWLGRFLSFTECFHFLIHLLNFYKVEVVYLWVWFTQKSRFIVAA